MALPSTMTFVEAAQPGPPDVLRAASRPVPVPGVGEVLIEVHAAGVNRPDVLQRLGRYPPPPGASDILGLEVGGCVVAKGEGVDLALGSRVCALLAGGGYAEYAVAAAALCLPVPDGLTMAEAAALPETVFTVWDNVFVRGALREGESLLVHGGTSGIGTTAIQLAAARGAHVFATAGSEAKCAACVALGAERAADRTREDFVAVLKEATGGRGVDVILDMVGGPFFARNLDLLAPDGRLVQIAFLQGGKVELDLMALMRKRAVVTGSTLRPRSTAQKAQVAQGVLREVWPLVAAGRLRPRIQATFALADAASAHRLMESGDLVGKVVLTRQRGPAATEVPGRP